MVVCVVFPPVACFCRGFVFAFLLLVLWCVLSWLLPVMSLHVVIVIIVVVASGLVAVVYCDCCVCFAVAAVVLVIIVVVVVIVLLVVLGLCWC